MDIPIKVNLPDQQVIDPLGQKIINMTISEIGVRQRPGSIRYADLGTGEPVTGIFDWREQRAIIAVSGTEVFKLISPTDGYILLEDGFKILTEDGSGYLKLESQEPSTELSGNANFSNTYRAKFANYGDYLYFTSGGRIVELHPAQSHVTHNSEHYVALFNNIDVEPGVHPDWAVYWAIDPVGGDAWNANIRYGSGNADPLEDSSAPTSVKFIAVADKYLLALEEGSQKMWFSKVGEPWSWDDDWVSAEFLPDKASCMLVYNGDVFVGGLDTIQQFSNDGVTPWVNSGYGAITSGVLAPYSFTSLNNGSLIYIDTNRRLVLMNNRTAKSMSSSFDTYLGDLDFVDDAIGDYISMDGVQYYILQLPSEQKTVAFNIDNGSWSEWLSHYPENVLKWHGNCITAVQPGGKILIGNAWDGTLEEISSRFDKDIDRDIVSTIRAPRTQTEDRMRSTELIIGFKKVATPVHIGESSLRVRWRDDGPDWSEYRVLDGSSEHTDYVGHLRRCGSYKNTRQYEFDCTHLHPYALQNVRQND